LPTLIRHLGVNEQPLEKCEEVTARRIIIEAALTRLEEIDGSDTPAMKAVRDDVANHYRVRLSALELKGVGTQALSQQNQMFETLTSELRNAERAAAVQLRDQERIGDEVLRTLLLELDLMDARPTPQHAGDSPNENRHSH
jgi:monovalent cation/hydrogen antiporter